MFRNIKQHNQITVRRFLRLRGRERSFTLSLTPQELKDDVQWNDRTRARLKWESKNIPLGEEGRTNWWSKTFGDKPINQRRIHEQDFDLRNPFGGYLGNKVDPVIR